MSQLVEKLFKSGHPSNLMSILTLILENTTTAGIQQMVVLEEFGATPPTQTRNGSTALSRDVCQSLRCSTSQLTVTNSLTSAMVSMGMRKQQQQQQDHLRHQEQEQQQQNTIQWKLI